MSLEQLRTQPQFEATGKKFLQDQYKSSLYLTAKHLLGFSDVNKQTHGRAIEILESDSKRKLLVLPRGFLKSTLGVVAFSIWSLINNPNERILINSELFNNSSTFLREIKKHIMSESFMAVFGDWRTKTWNDTEIIIKPRTKIYKEASIICGGIGTTRVGQHHSIIIADDMNSQNNTHTPEAAQKVIDHYKYGISILEPDGQYIIIATRYAANDLVGHILANESHDYDEKT